MTVISSTACFPPSPAAQAINPNRVEANHATTPWTICDRSAVLALLTPCLPASAQEIRSGRPLRKPAGPSFQSGGLKATVTSISAQGGNVALSLLIENRTQENLLVSVIGPPLGTNGGNMFDPVAIGGISYCIYNPQNNLRHQLERTFEINGCLKGEKPQLTPRHLYVDRCRQRGSDECRLRGVESRSIGRRISRSR